VRNKLKTIAKFRRAISPILATLLLIVIAVAAIVVTYAWTMTYTSSLTQQAGVILYKANVNFYTQSSVNKIDIDVGNSGTSDTGIYRVYCGLNPGNLTEQTPTQIVPIPVPAGSIARATIDYDWTSKGTYYFKIISSTGQTLGEWPEQAP
jgi:flagellin-like protein